MSQILTTDVVVPLKRAAFWEEMVSRAFVRALCRSPVGDAFRGSISTDAFGEMEISRVDAGRQSIERRKADIAASCKPRFYLCYQTAGVTHCRERYGENVLGLGDMILLDNCEPYTVEFEKPATMTVLHLPHEVLRDRFRLPERVVGQKLSGTRGVARLAGEFLNSCSSQADTLTAAQRSVVADLMLNLFVNMLADEVSEQTDAGTHQAVLLLRIKQHILSRLGEPDLSLQDAATSMGLSVRYVSRLFQIDGLSFGRYVLQKRIEHCGQDLVNPQLRNLRVSEIALRNGFNNFAHFSRVFRDAVGRSPTEYRAEKVIACPH